MQRSRWWVVVLAAAVVLVALVNTTEHRALAAADSQAKPQAADTKRADAPEDIVARGLAIAPVPLHYRRNLRDLVGLGSYIVNTGGCNDCHTNPPYTEGHDPFRGQPEQINTAGYLAGGQQFGPFTSRNLTPDANGLPAGLTWEQFLNTIRTGHDPDQAHPQISPLLQVMPWPVFGKKTDRDLRAVYEYLKAIPSIPGEPGE